MWKLTKTSTRTGSSIKEFMTPSPQTLGTNCHVLTAKKIMNENGFRHLPVVDNKIIAGVISDRDIKTLERIYGHKGLADVTLSDVCLFEPSTAKPDTPLKEVLNRMIEDKIGSVVVVERGKPIGIFTTIDVCKALRKVIGKRN